MNNHLNVALIQHHCSDDYQTNLAVISKGCREAAAQGAKLVLLQELHTSLYFCQTEDPRYFDLAESIPGPTTDSIGALAKELEIVIVASLFERRAPGLYHNTAVVLEADGSIAGRYRKMHIPDDPGFHEKFYFSPGDLGFTPIKTSVGKLGVLVCWDQWYPEAARLMALAGAEILLYPTAIGWDPDDNKAEQKRQLEAWITIQRSHAISNGLPVLSCNRTGFEPDTSGNGQGIQFWGNSFITGPQGEFMARGSEVDNQVVVAEISFKHSE
ncbi:MAG: carbon-nitrogen hydrolase, partial [Gammaproteobacteria bacterium]|nr:carbon-nitrogen hydrolase [Gammaproteobacteria bacterium]